MLQSIKQSKIYKELESLERYDETCHNCFDGYTYNTYFSYSNKSGTLDIDILAGPNAYCSPSESLEKVTDYDTIQLSIRDTGVDNLKKLDFSLIKQYKIPNSDRMYGGNFLNVPLLDFINFLLANKNIK